MQLQELKELGLTPGMSKVYASILESGIATLNRIQEVTGLERRGIYDIISKLIEKGLITYTVERGKKTYKCTHPNKLLEEIKSRQQSLQALEKKVPDIIALFNATKPEIRAEVYRGNEAIKAMLNEALSYKATYWIGGNSGVESTPLRYWFKHWMTRRVGKKQMMYDLVDYGTMLDGLNPGDMAAHKKNYYKYCQLPRALSSPMVIFIFGNKVAQILWSAKSFAIVIESKEVKDSFMRYFHHFWKEPW